MQPTGEVVKWQQVEIPEIKPLVHQWDLQVCACVNCKLEVTAKLNPEEQYLLGPKAEALLTVALSRWRMGHRAAREFFSRTPLKSRGR